MGLGLYCLLVATLIILSKLNCGAYIVRMVPLSIKLDVILGGMNQSVIELFAQNLISWRQCLDCTCS